MEVKINKEIREYSENMFFGLTLRQFFFSALSCAAAVGIYALCRKSLGVELTTWLCVLSVIPFAAFGFLRYNGMSFERALWAFLKTKVIFPRRYLSEPVTYYYHLMSDSIDERMGKNINRKRLLNDKDT